MKVYVDNHVPERSVFITSLQSHGVQVFYQGRQTIDWNDVHAAVVWRTIPEGLRNNNSLKLLMTCGSGIDHLSFHCIRNDVRIVRLVDPNLRMGVAQYVMQCLASFLTVNYKHTRPQVGILGLGLIGGAIAELLHQNDYAVLGWTRTSKINSQFPVHTGKEGLNSLAKKSEAIVCALPLTENTQGILNQTLFSAMPEGSYIINVGRGEHLSPADLLDALESKRLQKARLDVWSDYDPVLSNRLRTHKMVEITPHVAGGIAPDQQALYTKIVLDQYDKGRSIEGTVCVERGY